MTERMVEIIAMVIIFLGLLWFMGKITGGKP